MFNKNNQVFYYNAGRHKSVALKEIDAQSFIRIGHFTALPSEQYVIDTSFNPRAGETEYFYCKDRYGVYVIEEGFNSKAFSPTVTIYKLPQTDTKTFMINKALFPYCKDKNGVYLRTSKITNINPDLVNCAEDIDQVEGKAYEEIPPEIIYQYP